MSSSFRKKYKKAAKILCACGLGWILRYEISIILLFIAIILLFLCAIFWFPSTLLIIIIFLLFLTFLGLTFWI